jgi:hypothetical protein
MAAVDIRRISNPTAGEEHSPAKRYRIEASHAVCWKTEVCMDQFSSYLYFGTIEVHLIHRVKERCNENRDIEQCLGDGSLDRRRRAGKRKDASKEKDIDLLRLYERLRLT